MNVTFLLEIGPIQLIFSRNGRYWWLERKHKGISSHIAEYTSMFSSYLRIIHFNTVPVLYFIANADR